MASLLTFFSFFQVAQMFLNIPPNTAQHNEYAKCSATCTRRPAFGRTCINLVSANIHMHLTGSSGSIYIRKSNGVVQHIVEETNFQYNKPEEHMWNPGSEPKICPGDEVIVRCGFNSIGSKTPSHYGEGTQDEMCVGYLTYYPKRNFPFCAQGGNIDYCETNGEVIGGALPRCDFYNFLMGMTLWNIVNDASSSRSACLSNGCSSECLRKMLCTYYRQHPCLGYADLRHAVSEYLKEYYDPTDSTAPIYRMFGQKLDACHKAAMASTSPIRCNSMGGWNMPFGG